ncbi:MAG: T9SS type A sorting domain-containing protein [Bacteroidetes bacterium]|nr:T9SS type A sorting domain-containing protein [Bacteroidota bacterium]
MKKNRYKIFFSFIYFGCTISFSQNWSALDRGFNYPPRILFADTISNTLYAGGGFSKTGFWGDTNGKWVMGIAQWNGIFWDSLGCGVDNPSCLPSIGTPNNVLAITRYKNEIYAGGAFAYAGSISAWGIAKWDGNAWINIGDAQTYDALHNIIQGAVDGLYIYNNELYILGDFEIIGGINASKIAKFDGTTWTAFPPLDTTTGGSAISSAVFYHGDLYVAGNFDGGNGLKDIARFNGSNWQTVGGGFTGLNTGVNKLYVWNDTLFAGGYFQKTGGDPGNNIAAWDGVNWSDVGGGTMPANVNDIINFQGYLYVCGQIDNAGAIPVTRMARWDGKRWCNPGADFKLSNGWQSGTPNCMAVLNNELYVGGAFFTINADTVNNIGKLIGNSYVANCDSTAGINENNFSSQINIYPNPTTGIFTITSTEKISSIKITNVIGEEIVTSAINNQTSTIDLSIQPKGIYFIKLFSEKGIEIKKIILQ